MSARGHERHQEDVGAYLLGALSELETQAFEHHLARCAECRAEVERLRVASEALSSAVDPHRPGPELKARVMRAVEAERAAHGEADDGAATAFAGPAETEAEPGPPSSGAEPAAERRGRRRRRPFLTMPRPAVLVAGLVLLLAGALGGVGVVRVVEPSPVTVSAEVDRLRAPGGRATLVIRDRQSVPVLDVHGLPVPKGRRVYEVWVKRGERLVPQSLFDVSSDGSGTAGIPDGLEGADAVLVTEEPAGGRRKPTSDPILSVRL